MLFWTRRQRRSPRAWVPCRLRVHPRHQNIRRQRFGQWSENLASLLRQFSLPQGPRLLRCRLVVFRRRCCICKEDQFLHHMQVIFRPWRRSRIMHHHSFPDLLLRIFNIQQLLGQRLHPPAPHLASGPGLHLLAWQHSRQSCLTPRSACRLGLCWESRGTACPIHQHMILVFCLDHRPESLAQSWPWQLLCRLRVSIFSRCRRRSYLTILQRVLPHLHLRHLQCRPLQRGMDECTVRRR